MRDRDLYVATGLLVGFVIGIVVGGGIGSCSEEDVQHRMAIDAGAGHWENGANGKPRFKYEPSRN